MGQGVRTGLGHGGITFVLQTQFSSCIFSYTTEQTGRILTLILYVVFVQACTVIFIFSNPSESSCQLFPFKLAPSVSYRLFLKSILSLTAGRSRKSLMI